MLELIGLGTIVFLVIKYFPDLLKFLMYAIIVVMALYFLLGALLWVFGASIAFNLNTQLLGISGLTYTLESVYCKSKLN